MASFTITQQDLLIMSVTAHVCIIVELLANRMVVWLAPVFSERSSMVRTLMHLSKQRPGLLAKVLMEQITLWSIIVLILVALTYTSVSVKPFSHHPLPYPKVLIRLILSANVARFSVMAARIVLVRDTLIYQPKAVATPGQSGHSKLDFLYYAISASTALICLGYHENLLLGLTAAFMEVSSTPVECCRLIEQSQKSEDSRSYRKTTILNCALCFICRLILPLLFLILASKQESPFSMDEVPLIYFFISGFFYSIFNTLLLYQSIIRLRNSSHQSSFRSSPRLSSPSIPFSIHVLSSEVIEAKVKAENGHCHLKDYSLDHCRLTDINYDGLRSCDNCSLGSDEVQEMSNPGKKMVKHSNGDILNKFRFKYTGKDLVKTGSQDLLLGSQDLLLGSQDLLLGSEECLSEKKTDMLLAPVDNDCISYKQSEISDYQQSENSGSFSFQQSAINECHKYQQSDIDLPGISDSSTTNMPSHFITPHGDTIEDKRLLVFPYKVSGHKTETSALLDTGQCKTESGSGQVVYSTRYSSNSTTDCEDSNDTMGRASAACWTEAELERMCSQQSL